MIPNVAACIQVLKLPGGTKCCVGMIMLAAYLHSARGPQLQRADAMLAALYMGYRWVCELPITSLHQVLKYRGTVTRIQGGTRGAVGVGLGYRFTVQADPATQ